MSLLGVERERDDDDFFFEQERLVTIFFFVFARSIKITFFSSSSFSMMSDSPPASDFLPIAFRCPGCSHRVFHRLHVFISSIFLHLVALALFSVGTKKTKMYYRETREKRARAI